MSLKTWFDSFKLLWVQPQSEVNANPLERLSILENLDDEEDEELVAELEQHGLYTGRLSLQTFGLC